MASAHKPGGNKGSGKRSSIAIALAAAAAIAAIPFLYLGAYQAFGCTQRPFGSPVACSIMEIFEMD